MLSQKRIKEAEANVRQYLREGLLKKQSNDTALQMYVNNSENSLMTAQRLTSLESESYSPHLWVIVTSYYSMYYIANAILLKSGYRVGDKISHKITSDALIVFARGKLTKELLEEYENAKDDALELTAAKVDSLLESLDQERIKRSHFQYEMDDTLKKSKAITSLERAKAFVFEMKKLI
jgi:uncharacterized protein (UPF0332 family)